MGHVFPVHRHIPGVYCIFSISCMESVARSASGRLLVQLCAPLGDEGAASRHRYEDTILGQSADRASRQFVRLHELRLPELAVGIEVAQVAE
jgi:hypothetical protein